MNAKSKAAPFKQKQFCPDYLAYSQTPHAPFSGGSYNLSSMRPEPRCRTFHSEAVEETITRVAALIQDPDLKRLFINAYPNTLDTAIKWHGYADNSAGEELTFIITGDINAMWLRDSSNQLQSYLPLLNASDDFNSLASLYRGVINLQARYLLINPYCNSFQPPTESRIMPSTNDAAHNDKVYPPYDKNQVFECKYELDSLAAFLEISANYYNATNDAEFFKKYQWTKAVESILEVAQNMSVSTYQENGKPNTPSYTFTRETDRATETVPNDGIGNPFNGDSGLVRSFFRPSDDAAIFQGLIPSNMMFARYLESCADLAAAIDEPSLAAHMSDLASRLRTAVTKHGIVRTESNKTVYAYEVDGYSSENIMDDANIPSLLAAPFFGYLKAEDPIYHATRKLALSDENPYFMRGPYMASIGGPHDGPGKAWPMASIVRVLTSISQDEIFQQLREIVTTTDGLGLIHESINTFDPSDWTRPWFSWANGLFGQMIVELANNSPDVLQTTYQ
ncbi:glycoside hydrolase family 125 protein [Piedraia hortae CBS 480.64]|uniref:Glycoside hydrolase family 125 protein n=1 Tax=Piedraia hortae CBS 480.64 TaxID=1314780 RepID=A0A6A7BZ60_9PEZI|nr:glycoside hydrolase family 125 protein [Piedraia hortae CBS 480.64]